MSGVGRCESGVWRRRMRFGHGRNPFATGFRAFAPRRGSCETHRFGLGNSRMRIATVYSTSRLRVRKIPERRAIASKFGRHNSPRRAPTRGAPTNCQSFSHKKPASSRKRPLEFATAYYDLHSSRPFALGRAPTRGAPTGPWKGHPQGAPLPDSGSLTWFCPNLMQLPCPRAPCSWRDWRDWRRWIKRAQCRDVTENANEFLLVAAPQGIMGGLVGNHSDVLRYTGAPGPPTARPDATLKADPFVVERARLWMLHSSLLILSGVSL